MLVFTHRLSYVMTQVFDVQIGGSTREGVGRRWRQRRWKFSSLCFASLSAASCVTWVRHGHCFAVFVWKLSKKRGMPGMGFFRMIGDTFVSPEHWCKNLSLKRAHFFNIDLFPIPELVIYSCKLKQNYTMPRVHTMCCDSVCIAVCMTVVTYLTEAFGKDVVHQNRHTLSSHIDCKIWTDICVRCQVQAIVDAPDSG